MVAPLASLVTDKLFSAILDESIRAQALDKFVPECFYRGNIRAQAFWQKIANNKTQKTNNNQIQNINDQKIACRWVGL